jgi:NAD+ kinase
MGERLSQTEFRNPTNAVLSSEAATVSGCERPESGLALSWRLGETNMTMPIDLVLVRHGESEGNVARRFSLAGDNSVFTEEFCARHNSRLRLTDRGRRQAVSAGTWLKKNIGTHFDRYYVSGYARAMETAALLDLPGALWFQDFYLRERDLGLFEIMPEDDKRTKYPEAYRQHQLDPFYWTPPNGESIAELCLRIDRVLQTLHRECSEKRVLIVCHGLVIWAFMIRIERLTPIQYLERSQDTSWGIHNCQIVHYSRRGPDGAGIGNVVEWTRSICPWKEEAQGPWRKVQRPTFTNEHLLESIGEFPRVLVG